MEREEVAIKVKKLLSEQLGIDETTIKEEDSFLNDLGADSLDSIEIIMNFESEFCIEIPDEDARNIKTVVDAINYINGVVK